MYSLASAVVATAAQISTELDGEVVILNTANGKYYTLEGAGADLWQSLTKPQNDAVKVSALCATLQARYEVTPERCEADVLALLQSLAQAGLVELRD